MINLGDKIRDKVSGIEGIAVAKTEWLFGCVRFILQPEGKDNYSKPFEGFSVDEPQLEVVEKNVIKNQKDKPAKAGPRPDHQVTRR